MVSSKGLAPGGFHADGPWWPSRWTGGNIDPGQAPTVSSLRRRGEQYQTAPARTARSAATGQAAAPRGSSPAGGRSPGALSCPPCGCGPTVVVAPGGEASYGQLTPIGVAVTVGEGCRVPPPGWTAPNAEWALAMLRARSR